MNRNEHETLTIKVNGKQVEVIDKNGVTAKARCNPVDKFNIHVGLDIALQRLEDEQMKQKRKEAREKFRPFVCGDCQSPHDLNRFYGYIGDKTDLKDEFGEELLVGDTVKIKYKDGSYGDTHYSTICKEGLETCVMGFGSRFVRDDIVVVKMPRQKQTEYCTLIETYDECIHLYSKFFEPNIKQWN